MRVLLGVLGVGLGLGGLGVLGLLGTSACGRRDGRVEEIKKAPERELPRPPPAPDLPRNVVSNLVGYAGDVVSIEGRIALAPRPRIIEAPPGKRPLFIDVQPSHLLIVTYVGGDASEGPSCAAGIRLQGKVIVARGMVKSGSTEGEYAEPQLDVDRWWCL